MLRKLPTQVFIVAAKRTPFGAFSGKLSNYTANELGGFASKGALSQLPSDISVDSIIFGNVLQTSKDAAYLARHVGHRSGLPINIPALTVNRLCGSGFQAAINGFHEIQLGESNVVLTGGSESMSQAPHILRGGRQGARFGIDLKLEDSLSTALVDQYPSPTPMGITAENLGKQYNITRQQCDEYGLRSQQLYQNALEKNEFKNELIDVEYKNKKNIEILNQDEHPRSNTTIESLNKLPSVFIKNTGLVTAGNASGISDGAASIILASKEMVDKYQLKPLCEIISYSVVGVEPSIMGIGPVPAIKNVLNQSKLSLNDIDHIEINEAFAAQVLACQKELDINESKLNPHGGAIALGHPLGASGSRILAHLAYQIHHKNIEYGLGAACIGGGQGIAMLLKHV